MSGVDAAIGGVDRIALIVAAIAALSLARAPRRP
jgi:hypothetical protein